MKILTIPRPRAGVPRIPEPELQTNGELLMGGPWEQLSPRLCFLSFLTGVTEIFPKIPSLHFALLLGACGSARDANGSALTELFFTNLLVVLFSCHVLAVQDWGVLYLDLGRSSSFSDLSFFLCL